MLSENTVALSNGHVLVFIWHGIITLHHPGLRQHSHPTILLEQKLSEGKGGSQRMVLQCTVLENQHTFCTTTTR